jgi:hypothetical protein
MSRDSVQEPRIIANSCLWQEASSSSLGLIQCGRVAGLWLFLRNVGQWSSKHGVIRKTGANRSQVRAGVVGTATSAVAPGLVVLASVPSHSVVNAAAPGIVSDIAFDDGFPLC